MTTSKNEQNYDLDIDITVFRPKMEAVSPRRKSMRIVFMADRIRSGEFNGSVRLAARSPITLSMGISIGAIERQLRKVVPAAFAARPGWRIGRA